MQDKNTGFHPVLPDVDTAQETGYLSDHVPVITTILTQHFGEIKIASWNIFGSGEGGGRGDTLDAAFTLAKGEPSKKRHNKKGVLEGISTIANGQNPNLFFLQEIEEKVYPEDIDEGTLGALVMKGLCAEDAKLEFANYEKPTGKNKFTRIGSAGNATLCNKDFKNCMSEPLNLDFKNGAQVTLLQFSDEKTKYLCVWNVHYPYSVFPDDIEICVKKDMVNFEKWFLKAHPAEDISNVEHIFGGDFNGNFAPTHTGKSHQFICTSVAIQHNNGIQKCFSPDGFLYAKKEKGQYFFKQPEIQHLNPKTGAIYSNEELVANMRSLSEEQQKEAKRYKPLMCIDDFYKKEPLINQKTIFEYEDELQVIFGKLAIVRAAKNTIGQAAICVGFKIGCAENTKTDTNRQPVLLDAAKKIQEYIEEKYPEEGFQFNRESGSSSSTYFQTVYAPKGKEEILLEAIDYVIPNLNFNENLEEQDSFGENDGLLEAERPASYRQMASARLKVGGTVAMVAGNSVAGIALVPRFSATARHSFFGNSTDLGLVCHDLSNTTNISTADADLTNPNEKADIYCYLNPLTVIGVGSAFIGAVAFVIGCYLSDEPCCSNDEDSNDQGNIQSTQHKQYKSI